MKPDEITESQERLWRLGAALAPVSQLAAGCTWMEASAAVLLACLMQILLKSGKGKEKTSRSLAAVRRLLSAAGIISGMRLLNRYSPETGNPWVPIILLILAAVTVRREKKGSIQGGIILLWLNGILFAAILLSGITEIRWKNLAWEEIGFKWETACDLLGALLISGTGRPISGEKEPQISRLPWKALGAGAILWGLCGQGILSAQIQRSVLDPLYEINRSTRLLGTLKRFESLSILAVMLGYYQWMVFLLTIGENSKDNNEGKAGDWITVGLSILFYRFGGNIPLGMAAVTVAALEYGINKLLKEK